MNKMKSFIMTSLLGGVIVILPIAILAAVFGWVISFTTNLIQPLTDLIVASSDFKEIIADGIVFLVIFVTCFFFVCRLCSYIKFDLLKFH